VRARGDDVGLGEAVLVRAETFALDWTMAVTLRFGAFFAVAARRTLAD
jgi:hypothetical protein